MKKKLQPFMKAIAPAVLTVVGVGVDWLVVGTFDRQTAAIAITGLAASVVTYFTPNKGEAGSRRKLRPRQKVAHPQDASK